MANGRKRVVKQRGNNTKKPRGKPFEKGNTFGFKGHPEHINRNGAPRSHDELRQLIQAIGAEDVQGYTRVELKLRAMFASQKPPDNVAVLEHGWGKVPDEHQLKGTIEHTIRVVYDDAGNNGAAETPAPEAE